MLIVAKNTDGPIENFCSLATINWRGAMKEEAWQVAPDNTVQVVEPPGAEKVSIVLLAKRNSVNVKNIIW